MILSKLLRREEQLCLVFSLLQVYHSDISTIGQIILNKLFKVRNCTQLQWGQENKHMFVNFLGKQ